MVLQLMTYLTDTDLLPPLQSGFRPGHSTKSAVLCILSDILAVDHGNDIAEWMQSNRLQLNPGRRKLRSIQRHQNRLPTATLILGSTTAAPGSSLRDLGIFVNSDLVMRTHMCVRRCRAALQLCVSCAASASSSWRPSFSLLSLLLSSAGWTVVTEHWSACRPTLSVASSPCRTLCLD